MKHVEGFGERIQTSGTNSNRHAICCHPDTTHSALDSVNRHVRLVRMIVAAHLTLFDLEIYNGQEMTVTHLRLFMADLFYSRNARL